MNPAHRILVASTTSLLLVAASWGVAYAGQNTHQDPAKDVFSETDAGVDTVLPKRAEADITTIKVSYDGNTVHGTVHFRELRKKFRHHYLWLRDSHGGNTMALDVLTWKANPQGRNDGDCSAGTSWHFDYTKNLMTFTVSDQCVPASDWVRPDFTTYMSRSDAIAYLDSGYAKGAKRPTLGPKVFAN